MAQFSLTNLYGMTIRESANDGSDFTNPDADYRRLFLGEDGQLHVKDSSGTVTDIGAGSGIAATIFDAKGDLIAASAADTAARLAVGANAQGIVADSAESTGLKWVETLPWRHDISGLLGGNPMTNWALASAGNQYGGKVMQSTGAQNDEISFDLVMGAGTWTFTLFYYKHTICGIYTVSIDGSSIGTIDSYAASETPNIISSITGATVSLSGKHTVKLKMATKNASASQYYGIWTSFALIRTA